MAARRPKSLVARARLRDQIANLGAKRDKIAETIRRQQRDLEELRGERRRALRAEVRGDKGAPSVAEVEARIAAVERDLERQGELAQVVREEIGRADRALEALYVRDPKPFIDEARGVTEEAMQARRQALAAMQAARRADQRAREVWRTVIAAARRAGAGDRARPLGPMPGRPQLLESNYDLDQLRNAPPPMPVGADPKCNRGLIDTVPRRWRRALELGEPPKRDEPEAEGRG